MTLERELSDDIKQWVAHTGLELTAREVTPNAEPPVTMVDMRVRERVKLMIRREQMSFRVHELRRV